MREAEIAESKQQISELEEKFGNLKQTIGSLQETNDKIVLENSELKEAKDKDHTVQCEPCAIQ